MNKFFNTSKMPITHPAALQRLLLILNDNVILDLQCTLMHGFVFKNNITKLILN